jgi:hypothetical protein
MKITFDHLMSGPLGWWAILCGVSAVNLVAWTVTATGVWRRRVQTEPGLWAFRRAQLALSAVFVMVCAFRSIFPRADVQRICLHDSWLSSVMLGRSLATVAELCFAAQWAMLLRELGDKTESPWPKRVSRLIVPFIAVAEVCSWSAVITTSYLGNSFEESIWAISALLATVSAATVWPRLGRRHRPLLAGGVVFGLAYVSFMFTVDVPMYVSRWLADRANGRMYLTLAEGLRDVSFRWVVASGWDAWRTEIPWMSLYFSVTVWASIALVGMPSLTRADAPAPFRGALAEAPAPSVPPIAAATRAQPIVPAAGRAARRVPA